MNLLSEKAAAVQERMRQLLEGLPDENAHREALIHTYEVARFCSIFASKRGENTVLAECAGWLHDCWRYASGQSCNHAAEGATMARGWLAAMPLFSPAETQAICTAIFNHSRKESQDDPLSEILKDADVMSHFIADPAAVRVSAENRRLQSILAELSGNYSFETQTGEMALFQTADRILRFLSTLPEVRLCHMCGSLASGTHDAFSDIDIEVDVSGSDNGLFMLSLPELLSKQMKIVYSDFAPSLIPDKYVVSLALDERNPFLIADLCCTATPHCFSVTREQIKKMNRCETHLLKLWTANLKHYVRGLDCRADILRMADKCGILVPESKNDAQLLGEVLGWLEERLSGELDTLLKNCRRIYSERIG